MKINVAYPATGCQKLFEINDEHKVRFLFYIVFPSNITKRKCYFCSVQTFCNDDPLSSLRGRQAFDGARRLGEENLFPIRFYLILKKLI